MTLNSSSNVKLPCSFCGSDHRKGSCLCNYIALKTLNPEEYARLKEALA